MKYPFVRKPREYQMKALKKAIELGKLALWFDPGLGKTKVAIDYTAIQIARGKVRRVLVICPLSAIGVWEDEFPQDCPSEFMPAVIPVVGDMGERIETLNKFVDSKYPTVLIISYSSLYNEKVMGLLKSWKPDLLIADEMHFLKERTSIRTNRVYELRIKAPYFLGLTGTPIPKNPLDLFAQYKIINDEVFGKTSKDWKKFQERYAVMNYKFKSKVDSWRNLDELSRKIQVNSYRAKDSECVGLPDLTIQNIPVYLESKAKKAYNQMAEDLLTELEEGTIVASMAAIKALKLQQITGGFLMQTEEYLDENNIAKKQRFTYPVGTEKLDVLSELVDKYVDKSKIIIGCKFIWEIVQISDRLNKAGIEHGVIRGGVSAEERTQIRRDFQENDSMRVIIFQVSAATAMTLTAANIGILYSCTHKWDDYWQWLKRIHREGQTKPVHILQLVVRGSIDMKVLKAVNEKKSFTDSMVDIKSVKETIQLLK